MLDPSLDWNDVAAMVREWGGQFCLKGVMSVEDAKPAVEIGCTGIILSNHGGRQLDGSRTAFDPLAEIVDAVGDHRRPDSPRPQTIMAQHDADGHGSAVSRADQSSIPAARMVPLKPSNQ